MFVVKTYTQEHTCGHQNLNRNVGSTWLSQKYLEILRQDPTISKEAIKSLVAEELDVNVSDQQVQRAKRKAKDLIEGEEIEQYHVLRAYVDILFKNNPGSFIDLKTTERASENEECHFLRLFVCFGAVVKGFFEGCRPFVGLDGCHIRSGQPGVILSAVGIDANDQMYPITFALTEGECTSSWMWFLEDLHAALGKYMSISDLTFISDRQKGLIEAFKILLPNTEHRFCVRHLYKNFNEKGFRGKELRDRSPLGSSLCRDKARA